MPDFNSDKERGQGEIIYAVRPSRKGMAHKTKLKTGKGELETDSKGRLIVTDAALAAEMRNEYRATHAVSRLFRNAPADRGHHYFFGQIPEMPWKRQHREAEAQEEAVSLQAKAPAEERERETEVEDGKS